MFVRGDFLTRLNVIDSNDGILRFTNDRTNRNPVRRLKKFRTAEYPGHTHFCSLLLLAINYTSKNSTRFNIFLGQYYFTELFK